MCRWFAYRGAPLRTSELLLHPVHSIVAQSLSSPLGAEPVNGDGFGFGWYPSSGDGPPGLFHSIEPAWHDQNLRSLAEAIESPLFFCHVRAAAGPPIQQTNCHPFRHESWLFMHNGGIADYARVKRDLVLAVDPSLYPLMHGTTDSEVLFHLALTLGLKDDPVGAMSQAISYVERVGRGHDVRFPFQGTSLSPTATRSGPSATPPRAARARCSTRPTSPTCARCTRTRSASRCSPTTRT